MSTQSHFAANKSPSRAGPIPLNTTLEEQLLSLYQKFGAEETLTQFAKSHATQPPHYLLALFESTVLPIELARLVRSDGENGVKAFKARWGKGELDWNVPIPTIVRDVALKMYRELYMSNGEPAASFTLKQLFPSNPCKHWNAEMNAIRDKVHSDGVKAVVHERLGMSALARHYQEYKISPGEQRHLEQTFLNPLIEETARSAFMEGGPLAVARFLTKLEITSEDDIARRIHRDLDHSEVLRRAINQEGAGGVERFRISHNIDDPEWTSYYNPHVRIPTLGALVLEELRQNGSENIATFRSRYVINDEDWGEINTRFIEPFLCDLARDATNQIGWENGLALVSDRFKSLTGGESDLLCELLPNAIRQTIENDALKGDLSAKLLLEIRENHNLPAPLWETIMRETALPHIRRNLISICDKLTRPKQDLDELQILANSVRVMVSHLGSPDWLLQDHGVQECCKAIVAYVERTKPESRAATAMRLVFKLTPQ